MSKLKWWGASPNVGDAPELRRLDELFVGGSMFEEAESIGVKVRGVNILEREDTDWPFVSENDIIMATTFQFGKEPPVQRLHFMKDEVDLGWHGDFFNRTVLSKRDFKPKEDGILTLRIQVYDMNKVPKALIKGVGELAASAAVAFPPIAPYAGIVAFSGPALLKLIDHLTEHDRIIDERITLELSKEKTGHKLLQRGYYVCFRHAVDEGLSLSRNLRVLHRGSGEEFTDFSYAVLEVSEKVREAANWEIDQKIGKLLAELDGKGHSGEPPLVFLRETLDGYSKFKKLERALELQRKPKLAEAQKKLLDELLADSSLTPFLKNR